MARDYYETTIALPDATGAFKALSNVKVTLVPRNATDVAGSALNVYQTDQGVTTGPDPRSGATPQGKAFLTGTSGSVRFWADGPAEYDVVFEDQNVPARINDRIPWNAVPAKAGSIPTSYLAADGGITQAMLAPLVVQQEVPIGAVIDWWRPAGTVNSPDGFEICDGHQVNVHEFTGISGPINVPDLRNKFIIGASYNKTDGSGADQGDGPTQGPGIRGTGGTNAAFNLDHQHAVQGVQHIHQSYTPDHTHGAGTLYTGSHGHTVSASGSGTTSAPINDVGSASGTAFTRAGGNHQHNFSVSVSGSTNNVGNLGIAGSTAGQGQIASWTTNAYNASGQQPANFLDSVTKGAVNWVSTPSSDFRPAFYGLLKIMKVRRTA
jgi:hypothetical protein